MKETKETKEKKSKQVTPMVENSTSSNTESLTIEEDVVVSNPLDTFVLTEATSDVNIKELAEYAYKYNEVVMREASEIEKQSTATLAQKYITTEEFTEFKNLFDTILNLIKKYDVETDFMKSATSSELSEIQAVIKHYVSKLSRYYNGIKYHVVMNETEFDYFKTTIKNHIKISGDDMIKIGNTSKLLKVVVKETIQKGGLKTFNFNLKESIDLYNFFFKHTMTGVTTNFDDFHNIMLIFEDIYKLYTSMNNLGRIAKEECDTWLGAVVMLEQINEKK